MRDKTVLQRRTLRPSTQSSLHGRRLFEPNDGGPPNPEGWWQNPPDDRLRNVAVILMEPSRPENVGAAARALKTMGLCRLIVVGTSVWKTGKARALAVGAGDILESVEEYATLQEAVAGMKAVAVTTARRRRRARPVFPVDAAAPHLLGAAAKGPVGIVFGREEWGLTHRELLVGDWWVTIPMATSYPSLNLAQSVMLVSRELARSARGPLPAYPWDPAGRDDRMRVMEHAADTLLRAGLQPRPDITSFISSLGRMFDRGLMENKDVNLMHMIFHQMDIYMHMKEKESNEQS